MDRTGWAVGCAAVVLLVCGCAASSPVADRVTPAPRSPAPQALELGKGDLPLTAGEFSSPPGFVPSVRFTVGPGWNSVHRYPDAFDVGRPDPEADRPLVLVAVSTPAQGDAAAALDAVAAAQPDADVKAGEVTLLGLAAHRLDVVGGTGPAYRSRDGGIALDAAAGPRLRFLAVDTDDGVLVVTVLVAEGASATAGLAAADAVVSSLRAT